MRDKYRSLCPCQKISWLKYILKTIGRLLLNSTHSWRLQFFLARALQKDAGGPSNEEILDALSEFDMSHKIKLLKGLDLLPKYRGFLHRLSAIRNKYVHDIKKIKMSTKDYVKELLRSMHPKDSEKFFGDIAPYSKKNEQENEERATENIKQNPKFFIYFTAMMCIVELQKDKMEAIADLRSLAKYVLKRKYNVD